MTKWVQAVSTIMYESLYEDQLIERDAVAS
jgi:hypothetical protein